MPIRSPIKYIIHTGMNAYRENRFVEAIECFNTILQTDPHNYDAIMYKGLAQWKMIQYNMFGH